MGVDCIIPGCGAAVVALGLCRKHYSRQYRHGSPHHVERPANGTLSAWLQEHVDYDGAGCLTWPFARNLDGYAVLDFRGEHMLGGRAMCLLAHGEPPTSVHQAAHSCGRGDQGCVHPKHLSWKTVAENHADKRLHGTHATGEKVNGAKLSADEVAEIRSFKGRETQRALAAKFGVSRSEIGLIHQGKRWGVT